MSPLPGGAVAAGGRLDDAAGVDIAGVRPIFLGHDTGRGPDAETRGRRLATGAAGSIREGNDLALAGAVRPRDQDVGGCVALELFVAFALGLGEVTLGQPDVVGVREPVVPAGGLQRGHVQPGMLDPASKDGGSDERHDRSGDGNRFGFVEHRQLLVKRSP